MTLQELQQIFPNATEETWHQHPNGEGWVKNTATVDRTALVYGNALVSGNARVSGDARVYGNALVSGDARVYGDALVSGDAWEISPCQVHCHPYSVCASSYTTISVGCITRPIEYWQRGTPPDELADHPECQPWDEYQRAIDFVADWLKRHGGAK